MPEELQLFQNSEMLASEKGGFLTHPYHRAGSVSSRQLVPCGRKFLRHRP